MHFPSRHGFTLIELLVVIAIIAILSVVVVLTLNPAALLQQSRDSSRVSDMATLTSAFNLYSTDQSGSASFSTGSSSVVYVSIPDPVATTTAGDQCQGLNLITLPTGYTYHCAASSTYRNVNGTGWIPINFSNISSGSPLGALPVDPMNASSSRLYYTYVTNGTQFEMTAVMESQKYQAGGSNDVISPDGGRLASVYEKGSNLGLEPLDYGDPTLVGWWPLNEGTGAVAYDESGNNSTGTWNGTQVGTNDYYSAGNVQPWAGTFNGSTDYINAGSNALSQLTGDLTMTAWVNTTTTNGGRILSKRINGQQPGIEMYVNVGSNQPLDVYISDSVGYGTIPGPKSITDGNWHFVALSRAGGTINLFTDNANDSNPNTHTGSVVNTAPLLIGAEDIATLGGTGLASSTTSASTTARSLPPRLLQCITEENRLRISPTDETRHNPSSNQFRPPLLWVGEIA
jgi:prepilin-type N-terminal cleavage/methylation domain-containing protein